MTCCQRSCCPPSSSSSSSSSSSAPSSPFQHQHSTTPLTPSEEATLTRCKRERDYERELSLAHLRRQRQAIISCIACVLHQLFDHRCDILDAERLTMFHTEKKPSISVQAYFERIAKYGDCSTEALIFSLIHINRIMHQKPSFEITSLNIHRLLLTSIMCSAKFFDDHYFNNTYYSKIGGVPPHEMNSLEIEFLALINFDLSIDPAMFHQFESELCNPELHQECDCYYWQVQLQDGKHVTQQTYDMNKEMEYYQVMAPDGQAYDLRKPIATFTSTPVTAPVPVTIPVVAPCAPLSLASIIPITTQTKIKSSHPSPLVTAVDPSCCNSSNDSCHMSISPNIHMSPQSSCSSSSSSSSDSTHSSGSLSMSTSSSIHSSTNSSRSESPLPDSMSPLTSRSQKSPSATSSCTSSPCVYDTCPLDTCPIKPHQHSAQLVQAAR